MGYNHRIREREKVLEVLNKMSARVVVPFIWQEQPLGFLVLGERENQEVYSENILNSLNILGDQTALAVEHCAFLTHEKEMLDQQNTQARRESLDMLVSTMAHEIDNPITAVVGNVDLLKEDLSEFKKFLPNGAYENIAEMCDGIQKDAWRVSKIVKAVEDYSKGEKGKHHAVLISNVLIPYHSLLPMIRNAHPPAKYTEDVEDNLHPIWSEEILIEEILVNLAENAFHAVRFKKDNRHVVLDIKRKNNHVRIAFQDNGYGMTEKVRKQVFQVPTTTKGSAEGTGLGLYRVRQICELLNGTYGAESAGKDKGAVVWVKLPAYVGETKTPKASKPAGGMRNGKK
jgi:signal transduction histidine kinase